MLRKTRKAALFCETKKLGVIVDNIGSKSASIDVMAVGQNMVVEHSGILKNLYSQESLTKQIEIKQMD